jgi:hypothetical protein
MSWEEESNFWVPSRVKTKSPWSILVISTTVIYSSGAGTHCRTQLGMSSISYVKRYAASSSLREASYLVAAGMNI